MASHTNVVVLCPNGRRQNVKVNPNTSILQILEDACKKQGLNPQDYDILHYNKKLDLSLSVRYANVPNNAMLELCAATSQRQERPVTIALQLESGKRILNDFLPSCTLWEIIASCGQADHDHANTDQNEPVCIYMRREIIGKDELQKATLRSLGLTSGKAIIRLLYRPKEVLNTQAHVSAPLTKPASISDFVIDEWKPEPPLKKPHETPKPDSKRLDSLKDEQEKQSETSEEEAMDIQVENPYEGSFERENTFLPDPQSESTVTCHNTSANETVSVHHWGSGRSLIDDNKNVEVNPENNGTDENNEDDDTVYEVHYLGERDALLFHLDDIPKASYEEVSDDFFELTVDDALYLLADLKRQRRELEERPLETTLLRLNKQAARERRYRQTIIRIQFPDRLVLQACFSPDEVGTSVMEFVRGFLEDPKQDFYLFTTPPKKLLKNEETLYEANLVPAALLYFGTNRLLEGDILRTGLKNKITKAQAVFKASASVRKEIQKDGLSYWNPPTDVKAADAKKSDSLATSQSQIPASSDQTQDAGSLKEDQKKVPKWFKFPK